MLYISVYICFFNQDEKRRRHFLFIGITGTVLAAAAKASVKAEAPALEDEVKEKDEFEEEEEEVKTVKKSEKPKKSCVICVGSTGTGKSTLIKIMTGADVETSSRADSVTKTSSVYSKKRGFLSQDKKPPQYWIDTQGWEDSDIEKQDNQIFKDIFQCLWDNEMTEISGIIWNINPNERATDTLQRQARLI